MRSVKVELYSARLKRQFVDKVVENILLDRDVLVNKTRVIPHPMRRIGWGWIAGRALARLQLYSIEYGSGAHFSTIRHHQIPMDVTVADAVCAASK